MVLTEEERKQRKKENNEQYYQKNKEKIREYKRIWTNEYYKENKDVCNERNKNWRNNTYNGRKYNAVYNWKRYGVIHDDFDKLYELYINTTECNVCNKTFKKSNDKCLDHDHESGQFRQILCQSCNNHDHWRNKF